MQSPILVTGSHRSGTTWVGKILSTAPNRHFVGEPFNPVHIKYCSKVPVKHWFHMVTTEEDKLFKRYLSHQIGQAYYPSFLSSQHSSQDRLWHYLNGYGRCLLRHLVQRKAIVKDPIAFFSAPWFAERFQACIVILIRHPAAFVSSLKKVNWRFPFDHFLRQTELMETKLAYFKDEIKTYTDNPPGLIEQGILLWRIFHHTIQQYQAQYTDWFFVRHEDLSRSPLTQFQLLFRQLNLPFTPAVEAQIKSYNTPQLSEQEERSHHRLHRDSRTNIWAWRSHLSQIEIDRIRTGVADIAPHFYGNDDWFPPCSSD